jgi:hypothetical protein
VKGKQGMEATHHQRDSNILGYLQHAADHAYALFKRPGCSLANIAQRLSVVDGRSEAVEVDRFEDPLFPVSIFSSWVTTSVTY